MELAIHVEPEGAPYEVLAALAELTEECGFPVFARSDHYLPHERPDAPLGPTDAWLTLAALAKQTSRITLAALMVNPGFRHPSVLAVAMGQVSAMSGGRLEFGMGAGWFEHENDVFGLTMLSTPEARYDNRAEQIAVARAIWQATPDRPATYEGAYYSLQANPGLGLSAQRPFPRLVLALTDNPRTVVDAVALADEANIVFLDVDDTQQQLKLLDAECDRQGRERDALARSVVQVICSGATDADVERRAAVVGSSSSHLGGTSCVGTPAAVVEKLQRFADLGVSRAYLQIRDASDLDHVRLLADHVLPAFA
jgi:alkanesulfonate monooxygenase SsuD/methylene tetrahydromethanopterin reductase-like flavin-dependent oxidoreductase (luciferase family)